MVFHGSTTSLLVTVISLTSLIHVNKKHAFSYKLYLYYTMLTISMERDDKRCNVANTMLRFVKSSNYKMSPQHPGGRGEVTANTRYEF